MQKEFLEIGKIVNIHGVKGDVKVIPWCDSPQILCGLERLYTGGGGIIEVEYSRIFKNNVIMKLSGVNTAEKAQKLCGTVLYMHREDITLEDGAYYIQDLIGIDVFNADTGEYYGKIADVFPTGANDVYLIKNSDEKEYLVPAISDVISETDIDKEIMKIRPLKGLFGDED